MRNRLLICPLFLALGVLAVSTVSFAQVGIAISIRIAPPELPVYEQPVCPDDGYIWTPGYWSYDDNDYYWVPGAWVMPPDTGLLWTPGYWGWGDGGYSFNPGYWGPHVGFYGGISYGFGYFGHGYEGGRWDNGHFFYNRSVNNVNVAVVHNVYNTAVVNNNTAVSRVSFNGGSGGVSVRPTAAEVAVTREQHRPAVAAQTQQVQAARINPALRASANHGRPPVAAAANPGVISGRGAVAARAAVVTPIHPAELPPAARFDPPKTGNVGQDQKFQQQQAKLSAQQGQERQQLQQKQTQDHQRLTQQNASVATTNHLEQQHQQQTQQLVQKHAQQQKTLQAHQAPPHANPPAAAEKEKR
jgi:WXXGXW repeat (2 copies)